MKIILITPENRSNYIEEMDEGYKLRHRVFNNKMHWNLLDQDGREIDCYDVRALHFIAKKDDGTVVGTWRMMPTSGHYMAQDIFPELFETTGIISSDLVWELSRFAVDADHYGTDAEGLNSVIASLTSAALEFAIVNGITEFISIQNRIVTRMANKYIGKPVWKSKTIDAGACDATCYSYEPSIERLFALRAQFHLPSPVMSQYQLPGLRMAA